MCCEQLLSTAILLWINLFKPAICLAQSDSLLMQWAEFAEEETELIEIIQDLADDPLNINTALRDEFLRIPFISAAQTDSIIALRSKLGTYTSKRQIRSILGPELYDVIKDFITIRSRPHYRGYFIHKNHYGIEKIPEITNGSFQGNALYDYNKIVYELPLRLRFGLVTQKDIGEQNLTDYYTGFLEFNNLPGKIIVGNFFLNFGEGLLYSTALAQRKSALAILPFQTIKEGGFASLSTIENGSQFGLSTQLIPFNSTNFHLFYSQTKRDGQWNKEKQIIGLDFDGYHRTKSEIAKKDLVTETLWGIALSRQLGRMLKTGALFSQIKYQPALDYTVATVGENEFRRNRFNFSGHTLTQYGFYYNLQWQSFRLGSEYSNSVEGDPAFIQSLLIDLETIDFGIKYWRLGKKFFSPYGRTLDNSAPYPQAEEGIYLGLTVKPLKNLLLNSYQYIKKDLWRSYFESMPLNKDESFIELQYKLSKTSLLIRVRQKTKELIQQDLLDGAPVRSSAEQYLLRIQLQYEATQSLRFVTRWESTRLKSAPEKGTYVFKDILFTPNSFFSLSNRLIFYRVDSYNSRLYEYESDLPGSYANYAVYGEGYIWYILLKINVWSRLSAWLKYRYQFSKNSDLTVERILYDRNQLDRNIRFQMTIRL